MNLNSIYISRLTKSFSGREPIFHNANLFIKGGDFVFITGKSGSGKSTLLKMIHRLEKVDTGTIKIGEQDLGKLNIAELRQKIGFVFQDYRLLEEQTVEKNLKLPLYIRGFSTKQIKQRVVEVTESCGIEKLLKQDVASLSGGEKQLVALSRAAIANPNIILADEPTANLDNEAARKVIDLLWLFYSKGTTVLIATHDLALINSRKATIFLIKDKIIQHVSL